MLQLQLLRTQKELVQQRLGVKNYKDIEAIDTILKIDEERRKIQTENEELLAKINLASKEIGKMMPSGEKEQAETMKADVANYKESSKALSEKLSLLEQQQYDELVKLPNLPNELVPLGKTP